MANDQFHALEILGNATFSDATMNCAASFRFFS
jgi:hypothetical protein